MNAMMVREPRTILVITLRYLGDVLISTPVIPALRGAFPRASLSMLVKPGTDEMIAHNPHLDEELGVKVVLLGGTQDREMAEAILGQIGTGTRSPLCWPWMLRGGRRGLSICTIS